MRDDLNLKLIKENFLRHSFKTEDDIKIHFYADIMKPILEQVNPGGINQYKSEDHLLAGGRTDATFYHILFEFKKENYFSKKSGIDEALFGRKQKKKDRGLYHYIINHAELKKQDNTELMISKITNNIGFGFDGKQFIFARFIRTSANSKIDFSKTDIDFLPNISLHFEYEVVDFDLGLRRLVLLSKQQTKVALNKKNVLNIINAKDQFVRESILTIYKELIYNINVQPNAEIKMLFSEWDRVFGVMYGEDEQATEFTKVTPAIKEAYGLEEDAEIDSKKYLFAMQTFFNIFLKLLIYSFLSKLISPTFTTKTSLNQKEINLLFQGKNERENKIIDNFFEVHFLEWFIYSDKGFEEAIVNQILEKIDDFDLSTYILRPEEVQDILQEVYMELIPPKMRHLMGEYFSPDWIVEHALDMVGYDGDIEKSLIDPAAGSGTFLTQALKRIIQRKKGVLTKDEIMQITNRIVGFDINPISVVSAKANFILILFSAYFNNMGKSFGSAINIPIYIADSILSPVVYSEENDRTLEINTAAGKFTIPKFSNYKYASKFLDDLTFEIQKRPRFDNLWRKIYPDLVTEQEKPVVEKLFYEFTQGNKHTFWPTILRNSFAPIMIGDKFDFVVGNPPWIAWKSMSKSYREGTLKIWKSYGIFEKSAYDKKTTHDDFGMAVTYVAVDQYLKEGGHMVFLLPASFLKSTKGGEGFRKLSITRKGQDVPFSIKKVDDFSNVRLFTIPTVAIHVHKGTQMEYPLGNYRVWTQTGRKSNMDSHDKWEDVLPRLTCETLNAQPVDLSDPQSAWLTLPDMAFANRVLDSSKPRYYKGRKGIEPAGGKGVFILEQPEPADDNLIVIRNIITRQRREDLLRRGVHEEVIEKEFVYPMLGGRNIERWAVKSNEYMLVPHTAAHKYGVPEEELAKEAPRTLEWLEYFHDGLLASRIQNGKFFNQDIHPFYRLDNVGEYTYAPYKVLWKEQTGSMSAVTVGTYGSLPGAVNGLFELDKPIVVDSKVLMLALEDEMEAYFVSGVLNSPGIRRVIDGYAISTNRGVDVLKYIAVPRYRQQHELHAQIARCSQSIHHLAAKPDRSDREIKRNEQILEHLVHQMFMAL